MDASCFRTDRDLVRERAFDAVIRHSLHLVTIRERAGRPGPLRYRLTGVQVLPLPMLCVTVKMCMHGIDVGVFTEPIYFAYSQVW